MDTLKDLCLPGSLCLLILPLIQTLEERASQINAFLGRELQSFPEQSCGLWAHGLEGTTPFRTAIAAAAI